LALKRAEQDVETQQKKIENNQKTLYSGTVKNPKELEDLQNEAEALNRYLTVLEEKQLEEMISFEEAEAAHQEAEANLDKVKQQTADQNVILTNEQSELQKEAEKLEGQRQNEVSGIDAEDMANYTKLREIRGGLAVTTVENSICSACGATLTASQAQAARSPSKITTCDSCKRILYTP
jgi:predicted  nucleic acid-binding Zn-ribbon protein